MTDDPQLISKLTKLGVKKYDPAALSVLLAGKTDLLDSWTLKFSFIGFLVTGMVLENKGMGIDCAELADQAYILTGTGDKWLFQILKESTPENDPKRAMLFNKCYEHLLNTSLKSMFYNYKRKQIHLADGTTYYSLIRKSN